MNKLVKIAIRWQIREYAFHTDVCKLVLPTIFRAQCESNQDIDIWRQVQW